MRKTRQWRGDGTFAAPIAPDSHEAEPYTCANNAQEREPTEKGLEVNFEDLKNPEFQEKLKNAQAPEELVALAREEGVELSDGQLEAIAGGSWREGDTWCFDVDCKLLACKVYG